MDTDEEPSSLSLTPETETGHGRDDIIYIVVGLIYTTFTVWQITNYYVYLISSNFVLSFTFIQLKLNEFLIQFS